MKKIYTNYLHAAIIVMLAAIVSGNVFAGDVSWSVKHENAKVFIENKGQFPVANKDRIKSEDVLYAYDNGQTVIYFTKTGVTYAFNKKTKADGNMDIDMEKDGADKDSKAVTQTDIVTMTWENANADVQVLATDMIPDYYSYGIADGKEMRNVNGVRAYRTLRYNNLYPNIDVQYVFFYNNEDDRDMELEYSIILHPGADPSMIKMKYPEGRDLHIIKGVDVPGRGMLEVETAFGEAIFESHPRAYYADSNKVLGCHFMQVENTVSFAFCNYDNTREAVIDPFVVTPSFPNSNKVWEIEHDTLGNVYIYGGDMPMTLKKYNSSGTLQWTYYSPWDTTAYWVGTMICDKAGNCYITSGSNGEISKINTGGGLVWHNNPNVLFTSYEYWHLAFNCDESQLVIGGTKLAFTSIIGTVFNINLANGAIANSQTVGYQFGLSSNEARSICSSPNGNYYYLTLDTIGCINSSLAVQWAASTTYNFAYGIPSFGVTNQGVNAIRATNNYIYTQNGATLSKRDITNGNVITTVNIPGGVSTTIIFVGGNTPGNMGLDIDSCGNVYVGSTTGVIKYDANLNLISSAATPGAVYDVSVTYNGEVLACGDGFAASINMSACNPVKIICSSGCPTIVPIISGNTSFCSGGNTTLTASAGYASYSWSNGGTTQSIIVTTGGSYTVTVTDANACTGASSITVTVNPVPATSFVADTLNGCNPLTVHFTNNSTNANSYLWNFGDGNTDTAANPTHTYTTTGTFTVTLIGYGSGGCNDTTIMTNYITVVNATLPTVSFEVDTMDGCKPLLVHFTNTSTNATSFFWRFGDGGTSHLADPTHYYSYTGNFNVTLIAYDTTACGIFIDSVTQMYHFNVFNPPVTPIITVHGDTLISSFTAGNLWFKDPDSIPGAHNQDYIVTSNGCYYVVEIDSNGCKSRSDTVCFTTGINEVANYYGVSIYPNPNNGTFTLSYKQLSTAYSQFVIIDLLGRTVYSRDLNATAGMETIDITQLSDAVYFYQISNSKETVRGKFVKE